MSRIPKAINFLNDKVFTRVNLSYVSSFMSGGWAVGAVVDASRGEYLNAGLDLGISFAWAVATRYYFKAYKIAKRRKQVEEQSRENLTRRNLVRFFLNTDRLKANPDDFTIPEDDDPRVVSARIIIEGNYAEEIPEKQGHYRLTNEVRRGLGI